MPQSIASVHKTEQTAPFPGWPSFEEDEIEAAVRVLQSGKVNYWTGNEGRQFESEFAAFAGCKYAVALANGTVALEAALRALEIGPGDEVITTSRTFIASASSAVMVGARPVLADVDLDSQNLTAESIRAQLTPKTKAVIVVHLGGWPCDMDGILDLAHRYGLKVIEDCAQAHGATYKGRPVGGFGEVAAFSFCQDKIMTTAGEGGMVTTNHSTLWERMWAFKDHGKSYDAVYRREHPIGFRWLHESFGTNWRLTEPQSAIGRIQLKKVPGWVSTRRKYAAMLASRFATIPGLRVVEPTAQFGHSYYRYYAFVRPEMLRPAWNRERIMAEITAQRIPCSIGSCGEIYLEKAFPSNWRPQPRFPMAREGGDTSLAFLVHPTLTEEHIEATCRAVERVMELAVEPWATARLPSQTRF